MHRRVSIPALTEVQSFDIIADVLEYSGIAWPNLRMFESIQRDPRRPGPVSTRLPSGIGQDAHAHSPQRSMSAGLRNSLHGLDSAAVPGHQTYYSSGNTVITKASSSQPNGLVSARALTRDEDPFMGPASTSRQWRMKTRSNSTDETMPDYMSAGIGHSRTSTDMSVQWPRRDFQRHMDEAAVDEIVQALSPEKRDELLDALSPMKSSSSGLAPPANTPKTAEVSKQPTPVLKGANELSSVHDLNLDRLASRSRSTSDDSAVGTSESERGSSAGIGKRERSDLERTVVTRSQKLKGSANIDRLEVGPMAQRSRSISDSSKRRKLSLSPSTDGKTTREITLRIGPTDASNDKENQQLAEGESEAEGVAITIE